MDPSWAGATKVCLPHLGHVIKMAAMPTYGKNPLKSSPELKGQWPWDVVCSIGNMGHIKFENIITFG